jgi:hypothetical protein
MDRTSIREVSSFQNVASIYSLDIGPCDFWLFDTMKRILKSQELATTDENWKVIEDFWNYFLFDNMQNVFRNGMSCFADVIVNGQMNSLLQIQQMWISNRIFFALWAFEPNSILYKIIDFFMHDCYIRVRLGIHYCFKKCFGRYFEEYPYAFLSIVDNEWPFGQDHLYPVLTDCGHNSYNPYEFLAASQVNESCDITKDQ